MVNEFERPQDITPPDRGGFTSAEIQIKAQLELKVYAESATIGSAKLLALNDMSNLLEARINTGRAKIAFKSDPSNGENKIDLIVAKMNERQTQREIDHRDISVLGYYEANSELIEKLNSLIYSYNTAGFKEFDLDRLLSRDFSRLRQIALKRNMQQAQTPAQQ